MTSRLKNRKAPAEHAADHIGETKIGLDGNIWYSNPSSKRWIRADKEEKPTRKIHKLTKTHQVESKSGALEIQAWKKHVRKECLTIRDIKKLKPGDKLTILCMDRNLEDPIWQTIKSNTIMSPTRFFQRNVATYVHEKDLHGTITFHFGGLSDHSKSENSTMDFDFELEYRKDHWYPTKDGYFPAKDGYPKLKYPKTHWTKFPPKTKVGWRGPMLLWEKVKTQPKVYWAPL